MFRDKRGFIELAAVQRQPPSLQVNMTQCMFYYIREPSYRALLAPPSLAPLYPSMLYPVRPPSRDAPLRRNMVRDVPRVLLHVMLFARSLAPSGSKAVARAQGGGGAGGAEEPRPTITMPGATAAHARYADYDDDRPPSAGVSTPLLLCFPVCERCTECCGKNTAPQYCF